VRAPEARRGTHLRRRALLCIAAIAGAAGLAALPGCGGSSQLVVNVTTGQAGNLKPGDTATFTVSVVNKGPGEASGVTIRIDLPPSLTYNVTTSALSDERTGSVRTQPQDPPAKSPNPSWGTWVIAAPVTQADGTVKRGHVDLTFSATVSGAPGDYQIIPHVFSDSTDAEVVGPATKVTLDAAPSLQFTVTAEQGKVKADQDLLYKLSMTNGGTGPAEDVSILVVLPQVLGFSHTETISGNSSRDGSAEPVRGSLEVLYSGFTVPAQGQGGPGVLTVVFRAHCYRGVAAGRYTVTAQVVDRHGLVGVITEVAAITVEP
jgi:uncharacterized repeat protein (TIGR01451 family)